MSKVTVVPAATLKLLLCARRLPHQVDRGGAIELGSPIRNITEHIELSTSVLLDSERIKVLRGNLDSLCVAHDTTTSPQGHMHLICRGRWKRGGNGRLGSYPSKPVGLCPAPLTSMQTRNVAYNLKFVDSLN